MSKFRAALVSTLLATALVGGAMATGSGAEAAPTLRNGHSYCC